MAVATPDAALSLMLRGWRDWSLARPLTEAPRAGALLHQGSGHRVFRLLCSEPLVARLRCRPTQKLQGGFEREIAIARQAAQAGLAPQIHAVDQAAQTMVMEYADSSLLRPDIRQLGVLLRAIHTLEPVPWRLDLRQALEHYLDELPLPQRARWSGVIADDKHQLALRVLEQDPVFLCHNDLTPGNLLWLDNRLVAIDWEYAAMGSRYFDAAIVAQALPHAEQHILLNIVFDNDWDPQRFSAGQIVADLVTELWSAAFGGAACMRPAD